MKTVRLRKRNKRKQAGKAVAPLNKKVKVASKKGAKIGRDDSSLYMRPKG